MIAQKSSLSSEFKTLDVTGAAVAKLTTSKLDAVGLVSCSVRTHLLRNDN